MTTIRKRENKKTKTSSYQALVRISGQDTLTETFDSYQEALEWGDAMTAAARASVRRIPKVKDYRKILLKDAIQEFIDKEPPKSKYVPIARKVLTFCGNVSMGRITDDYIDEYVATLRRTNTQYGSPYKQSSITKHLDIIRNAIKTQAKKYCVDPGLDVVSHSKTGKKEDNARERVLGYDEEKKLIEGFKTCRTKDHWPLLLTIAIETGAREGEIVLAEPPELDLTEGLWIIPANHTKAKKRREVPLSKAARSAFESLLVLMAARNTIKDKPPVNRLFWRYASADSLSTSFAKIVRRQKIDNFHFHDLRHTAVTRMVLNKRDLHVIEIMRIVGHESIKMFNRYANIRGGDLVDRMG
jgi:integrase